MESLVTNSVDLKTLNELQAKLYSRRDRIQLKLSTAPYIRLMDKISFIVGVLVVWMFAYFLGRYPKDFFFTFFTILIIPLVLFRWIRYYKIGMHYYLIDLCYFSLALILYTIWYDPKNEALMRVGFLTANGCLAVSIAAFRNSLVFHDMDCITSMGLHAAPMIITHHIRWYMITEEASLPEEQRTFATISTSLRLEEYLHLNMWNPIAFYVIWLAFYAFVNFYLAESTIKRKKYNTLYIYFSENPFWYKILVKNKRYFGENSGPISFLIGHFVFFFVSHVLAMVEFEYYYFNVLMMSIYIGFSLWNGANYYMEYFAKKYEAKLVQLDALAGKPMSVEEARKAAWAE